MKKWLAVASLILTQSVLASVNIWDEARDLNQRFNSYSSYPIVVFEKDILLPKLKGLTEISQQKVIREYISTKTDIELSDNDISNLIPYFGIMNGSATAVPLMNDSYDGKKFCAVMAADNQNSLIEETKRTLGITAVNNPYPSKAVSALSERFSLDELKLFSLYHELSHCLDSSLLKAMGDHSVHSIHMNESFAETNALLMLYKEKNMRRLGVKRAQLRALYSKYMGHYLATDQDLIVFDESMRSGGMIYYLTPSLMAAERYIEDYRSEILAADTEELIKISESIIKTNALTSRQMAAMKAYFQQGRDATLQQYQELAQDMPDLIYSTYLFLIELDTLMERI